MKIISVGKRPDEKTATVHCRCNTVFEFAKNEGRYVSDQRDGDCIAIKCPTCGQENWVDVRLFH